MITRDQLLSLAIVTAATAGFGWIVLQLFQPILWAVAAAVLFSPLYHKLASRMPRAPSAAALLTVLTLFVAVVIPAIAIIRTLIREATALYGQVATGQIDPAAVAERVRARLPMPTRSVLDWLGITDFAAIRQLMSQAATSSYRAILSGAFAAGQSTFILVIDVALTLYLTFFFLRDGDAILRKSMTALPFAPNTITAFRDRFTLMVHATVRGTIIVAVIQGITGGMVFMALGIHAPILWGALMALFALIPTIGTGFVWAPVAFYLLMTGEVGKGLLLLALGLFVISLIDNLVRPILVGREAQIPSFVILVATLGALEIWGFSGILIGPLVCALAISAWHFAATHQTARTI